MRGQCVIPPDEKIASVPPQVQNLARRERELAVMVYLQGPMTAKVLEARLPRDLSNSALRSMLARLCRKGILKRRKITGSHLSSDRRIPYVYSPAITPDAVRRRALLQFASDYFGGSLLLVAQTLTEVLNDDAISVSVKNRGRRSSDTAGMHIAA